MGDEKLPAAMIDAGVKAAMDFYPAEWGSHRGITQFEAKLLVTTVLQAALSQLLPSSGNETQEVLDTNR